ncbi:MAG: serine/threonine-protein kinase [Spirochaetales bacterium]|uniref:Serine/threonine-protein kinase n=1 Tax=Candidatus Thalassospirochaeta sargassi TaxID=3119039 RepID=A0AAJ1IAK3_9SPIO|nr:serine/threonine-protein kinase [Spirochaetales bacterium]
MAKIPDQIDKYKIEELVATGGMGAVFKGIHPTLKRPVILKKLTLRGNATITERFKREARILMDFRNDNIVDVQDHFVQGRSHYIVMEYVDGQSLKDLLDEQRYLDSCTAAYILLYTAKALKYAHSKGVVHRDIKPGNILISRTGEIKLADFGIASSTAGDFEDDTLTTEGMTLGTPAYMAPEQFENSRTVDYRADLYSLGVMMYETLTGLKPFPGSFSPETVRRIQKGKYKPPGRINPSIAKPLRRIINSLIKPRPRSRCRDIDKVIKRLEAWLARYSMDDVRARLCAMIEEQAPPPVSRKRGTSRKLYITAGIILLAAAAVVFSICRISGLHRLLFYPSRYGRLEFTIENPAGGAGFIPQTTMFIDDGKDIPRVDSAVRYLRRKSEYRSLPVILEAGRYRAKTIIGNEIIWSSFELSPAADSNEMRSITIDAFETEAAPISIDWSINNSVTGADIRSEARVEVYNEGSYVPVDTTEIYSGAVYSFRITADGYREQEWVLRINNDQKVLRFQAELIPQNGEEQK